MACQTERINGVDLSFADHGDPTGRPVLLLHGGIGSTEDWAGQVPALVAAGYRVVAMDGRAHGRSAWGDRPLTFELMADDALALLDRLGIAETDLVGWSDSAIIGLYLAIHHPDRLGKLVAFGGQYTPDGSVEPVPTPAFDAVIARLEGDFRRLSPHPERFDELSDMLAALYAVAPNFAEAELRGITVPVLVLDGADEELIAPDHPAKMAALIPGSELVIMPGTGHFAPFEQPDEFNRIVLAFLAA